MCRSTTLAALTALAVVLLPATPVGIADAQTPQFGAAVAILRVDAVVLDEDGTFVGGLSADDFVVEVDGEARPIRDVTEIDLRGGAPESAATAAGAMAFGRQFLFVLDQGFNSRRGFSRARDGAAAFVERGLHPTDYAAVATLAPDGVELVADLSRHHGSVATAIRSVTRGRYVQRRASPLAPSPGDVSGRSPAGVEIEVPRPGPLAIESEGEAATHFAYLEDLLEALRAVPGPKHLVLLSRGVGDDLFSGGGLAGLAQWTERQSSEIALPDLDTAYGSPEARALLGDFVRRLRVLGIAFHAIDPSGLQPGRAAHHVLAAVAEASDGSASWNTNDIAPTLESITDRASRHYVLAVQVPADRSGEVEVRVSAADGALVLRPRRLVVLGG